MRRALLKAVGEIEIEDIDLGPVSTGEARIRVEVAGICGSDVHAFQGTHPFVHPPIVLGHELAGTVVEADGIASGTRVTIEPNVVCGECAQCRSGRYNICDQLQVIGCVGRDGGFAQYVDVPADRVVPLPEAMSPAQGAMVEPLAVGVHAAERASPLGAGAAALVLGAGTIGIVTGLVLKQVWSCSVTIVDLLRERLNVGRELGLEQTIWTGEDALVPQLTRDNRLGTYDVIFDCVGTRKTLQDAIAIARKGTQIILVGVPAGELAVNMAFLQDRELELIGSLMYTRSDYSRAIDLLASGETDLLPLITQVIRLDDLQQALEMLSDPRSAASALKVHIHPWT